MRIGIDARLYGILGRGLGRYVSELIRELEEIDSENEYVIFLRKENFEEYVPKNPRFSKVLADIPWYSLKEQLAFPVLLQKYRLDLVHFPHFNVPMLYRKPHVVTVHDLILLSHPTTRATTLGPLLYKIKYWMYRLVIWNALRSASTIITVSEYSKQEIISRFPFTKKKNIVVTHEGVSKLLAGIPDRSDQVRGTTTPLQSELTASGATKKEILYVGSAYPHKNLERLVDAFALFKTSHPDHTLVLVGAKDYFYNRLEQEIKKKNIKDVTFFGRATDAQLSQLYHQAQFYIFPSLCEGFGLPPLEAMAHGLPVTAGSTCALPEILNNAAYFFDPTRTDDIVRAMNDMASNSSLRNTLKEKGLIHIQQFSWRQCVEATRAVYLSHYQNQRPCEA